MTFSITGTDPAERSPAGCVARFLLAGAASDNDAAVAELHPDSRAEISGSVKSPPGVIGATILVPEDQGDKILIPTQLANDDGTEQRFVFVVKPTDGDWGVHLQESLAATFGGDPAQMLQDAMTAAVAPLGEAMAQMGEGLNQAFAGSDGSPAPAPRRLRVDEPLPQDLNAFPSAIIAQPTELDWRRRVQRVDGESVTSTELTLRCQFELDPQWTAVACTGVTIIEATAIDGADLRPAEASESLGAESYSSWEQERRDVYARLPLTAPPGTFSGLAALSGVVRLALVGGELMEVDLGPVGDLIGRQVPVAAFAIELAIERDSDGYLVIRAPYGWFDRLTELRMVEANGERISENWSGQGDGETSTRVYQSDIPDQARIYLQFWAISDTAEMPFTCTGLPWAFP